MWADRYVSSGGGGGQDGRRACLHTQTLPFLGRPLPHPGLFTQSCLLPFQVTKALWGHQDPKVCCRCSDIPIIA